MKKALLFFSALSCFCGGGPSSVKGDIGQYVDTLLSVSGLCDTLFKKIDSGEIEEFEQLGLDKLSNENQEFALNLLYDHLEKGRPNLTTKQAMLRLKIASYQLEQSNKFNLWRFLHQSAWFVLPFLIIGLVVSLIVRCPIKVRANCKIFTY